MNNWLFILMIICIIYLPALNASDDRRRTSRHGGRITRTGSTGGEGAGPGTTGGGSTGGPGAEAGAGSGGGQCTPCCPASGGSDAKLLLGLLQLYTELGNRITSNTQLIDERISGLRTLLDSAPIIPPFTAVNYAICTGRPTPQSGVATGENISSNEDLRCGPNSQEIIGPNGERDIEQGTMDTGRPDLVGTGILPGPFFSVARFGGSTFTPPTIETCEQKCIETDLCLSYNWIVVDGDFNCELYDTDVADNFVPNENFAPDAIILCKPSTDTCTLGEIITFAGDVDTLPSLYRLANGDQVSEEDYPGICEILQNIYGVDDDYDLSTCLLPDLRGKFLAGVGEIGGTEFGLGEMGGTADLEFGAE